MSGNLNYQTIIEETPAGIQQDVMGVLAGHVGSEQRISREKLVDTLAHDPVYRSKRRVRLDRMVRKAIADLQELGYPILSDSGKGGYWLAGNKEEVEGMLREIGSRVVHLGKKYSALARAGKRTFAMDGPAVQLRLEQ